MMLQSQANTASLFPNNTASLFPNNTASHFQNNTASHLLQSMLQSPFIPAQTQLLPQFNNFPTANSGNIFPAFGVSAPAQHPAAVAGRFGQYPAAVAGRFGQQPAAVAGQFGQQPAWAVAGADAPSSYFPRVGGSCLPGGVAGDIHQLSDSGDNIDFNGRHAQELRGSFATTSSYFPGVGGSCLPGAVAGDIHPLSDSCDNIDFNGRHAQELRGSFATTQDVSDKFSVMAGDTLKSQHGDDGAVPLGRKRKPKRGLAGGGVRAKKAAKPVGCGDGGGSLTDSAAADLDGGGGVNMTPEERLELRQKNNRKSAAASHAKNKKFANEREDSIKKLKKDLEERDASIAKRDQLIVDMEARNVKFREVMVEACRAGKSASVVFDELEVLRVFDELEVLRVEGWTCPGAVGSA